MNSTKEKLIEEFDALLQEFIDIRLYASQWEHKYGEDWDAVELRAKTFLDRLKEME
jgi:hypothetical protein